MEQECDLVTLKIDGKPMPQEATDKIIEYAFDEDKGSRKSENFLKWIHKKPSSFVDKLDTVTWAVERFGIKNGDELAAIDEYIDEDTRDVKKVERILKNYRGR